MYGLSPVKNLHTPHTPSNVVEAPGNASVLFGVQF